MLLLQEETSQLYEMMSNSHAYFLAFSLVCLEAAEIGLTLSKGFESPSAV